MGDQRPEQASPEVVEREQHGYIHAGATSAIVDTAGGCARGERVVNPHTWMIGLDSWIIQDGNYPDFVTGQRADFALEFAGRGGLRRLDETHEVSARWIEDSRYEVTAQIVHDEPNAQVLDLGILAYHFIGIEDPEHRAHVGAWVTGEINLSVDPFFYFDELAREEGFPALSYAWTVQEILQKNRQDVHRHGADDVQADKTPGFFRIEKTDAWGDDSKLPTYLLRCRLGTAATSITAGPTALAPRRASTDDRREPGST